MARREQGWDVEFARVLGKIDSALLAAKPDVAKHKVHLFAVEYPQRLGEVVDRADDLISSLSQHIFVVERSQRLILDDEDALDELLPLAEQHPDPEK